MADRVLVVDDDPEIRALLASILRMEGMEVDQACDGRDALGQIRGNDYLAALVDLQMPELGGLDLLERLSQERISLPVIVVSGQGTASEAVRAMRLGARDYVEKPFTAQRIMEALREIRVKRTEEKAGGFGRYVPDKIIAQGGMGTIIRAYDPRIKRKVAIKLLRCPPGLSTDERLEMEARFRREAEVVGRLSHPNIVSVYDFGIHKGDPFLVLEYIDGENLASYLDRQTRLEPSAALELIIQVQQSLTSAHEQGVIHRDIKPSNILISKDGWIKLTDFGMAKIPESSLTRMDRVVGTLTYLSPEQLRGDQADNRSDQFSLGIVFYECLTGVHPFEDESSIKVAQKILTDTPADPRSFQADLPLPMLRVLASMIARDPSYRYQHDRHLLAALMGCRAA